MPAEKGTAAAKRPNNRRPKGSANGNDKGRKAGVPNRRTREVIAKIDEAGENPIDGLIALRQKFEQAGDLENAMHCIKALLPYHSVRRRPTSETMVTFALPKIETAEDAAKAMAEVLALVGSSEMTLEEARAVADLIETFRRTLETSEIAEMYEEWRNEKNAKQS